MAKILKGLQIKVPLSSREKNGRQYDDGLTSSSERSLIMLSVKRAYKCWSKSTHFFYMQHSLSKAYPLKFVALKERWNIRKVKNPIKL